MGILNRLFGSGESVAKEIELDDETILKHWNDYLKTVPKKKKVMEEFYYLLQQGEDFKKKLLELKKLLKLELVDIGSEEKEEEEVVADLESMRHFKRIRQVDRLWYCLGYAATEYEYVHGLLGHIHLSLTTQMHTVKLLIRGVKKIKNAKTLIHQGLSMEAEEGAIERIKEIKKMNMRPFHDLFLALVKGEHIIRQMDAKEKKLLRKMQQILGKAVNDDWSEDMYRKMLKGKWKKDVMKSWVMLVYNATEEKIDECIAEGAIRGHHQYVEFEMVNKPAFVDLCRDCYKQIMKRQVNDSLLNVFVHVFREWFNSK